MNILLILIIIAIVVLIIFKFFNIPKIFEYYKSNKVHFTDENKYVLFKSDDPVSDLLILDSKYKEEKDD